MSLALSNRVWIDVVKQVLEDAGHNSNECLSKGKYQDIDPQAQQVDTRAAGEAWRIAAKITHDPLIGLKAAQKYFQPTLWGSLGLGVLCSHSLRDAMSRMVHYSRYFSNISPYTLVETEDTLSLVMRPLSNIRSIGSESVDFAVASFVSLFRELFKRPLSPVAVHLFRKRIENPQPYTDFYGCEVSTGSDAAVITFARCDTDLLLPTYNPQLAAWQDQFTETYIEQVQSDGLIHQVKRCVLLAIESAEEPNCKKIARQLNLSQRSLQRRLSAEDTTFTALVSDVRKRLALEYLQAPSATLNETAYRLGFSDHSSFTRAFKRWYGKSPTEYCA